MSKRAIKAKRWERRRLRKLRNDFLRAQRCYVFSCGRMYGKTTMQEIWIREYCCINQDPEITRRATMALEAVTKNRHQL